MAKGAMFKRAHIHHKDGNPINNPPDGSNWEVLCFRCHSKAEARRYKDNDNKKGNNKDGIYLTTRFAPWKRAEIIRDRGYRCEKCGVDLSLVRTRTSGKPRPRCITCGLIIDRKRDEIHWKDGKIMCVECFDKYF